MPRSYRRKPATRRSSSNIHPPPPKKEAAPFNLFVAKGFTAWGEQNDYSLKEVPFVPSHPDCDKVHYKITYKTSPQLTSADAEGTGTVEPHVFLGDMANDKIRLNSGGLISISAIETLHLQMPVADLPALKNRVFSNLEALIYVGDLREPGAITWSTCFPNMTSFQAQGEMSCSIFREILEGPRELKTFTVNLLVEDTVEDGQPSSGQIKHTKLTCLEVVSYTSVKNAFNDLHLKALKGLKLWMMPNVARELRYEDLGITIYGKASLELNFDAREEFKERATEGNWKFAVME